MRLFGGWLPFIGFRDLLREANRETMRAFGFEQLPEVVGVRVFELEWFHHGLTILIEPLYDQGD